MNFWKLSKRYISNLWIIIFHSKKELFLKLVKPSGSQSVAFGSPASKSHLLKLFFPLRVKLTY